MERRETTEARRRDTRDKIALGGLIVKAGLRHERKALILGALIDLVERLETDPGERARLTALGAREFLNARD